jgi:hypothetical protein
MPPRRADRSCSVAKCPDEFYADDLCKRHYYRKKRLGDPLAFRIARQRDRYNAEGRRWCPGHQQYLDPDQFMPSDKYRCRVCRRLEKYGMSIEEFDALGAESSFICPICEKRPADVIDHDHETNKVRGLLCRQCNIAIGTVTDQGVFRAAAYLARHNTKETKDAH